MSAPKIDLHIERLVLHDLPRGDRDRIAAAIERELMRLFDEHGVPESLSCSGEHTRMEGGGFDVPHGSNADAIGAHVARQIHHRMTAGSGAEPVARGAGAQPGRERR